MRGRGEWPVLLDRYPWTRESDRFSSGATTERPVTPSKGTSTKISRVERRTFLQHVAIAGLTWDAATARALAQGHQSGDADVSIPTRCRLPTKTGATSGFPIVLLHGFPDDVRAYDAWCHRSRRRLPDLVPYLRGYGPTRFRDPGAPRMAEQAAIGQDVIDFADAMRLARFAVSGYDWGGRAAASPRRCIPSRVRAAVLISGYSIQNTIAPPRPGRRKQTSASGISGTSTPSGAAPGSPRIVARCVASSVAADSPTWQFTDEIRPDGGVVRQSGFRRRRDSFLPAPIGTLPVNHASRTWRRRLAERPKITAPTITLYGAEDGVVRPAAEAPAAEKAVFV